VKRKPKKIGIVHHKHSMFLRVHGAEATNGKMKYECSAAVNSMAPIIVSAQTGQSFTLSWQEIINLAIDAGIDKPLPEKP
jgi:hypothetical protein